MIWTYHVSFICPVDGHLGHFQFLAISSSVGMNIFVYVVIWTYVFISIG